MDISIFGIGYVGAVSAACLCRSGHRVVAIDPSEAKVDAINRGESPIIEPGLADLIRTAVDEKRLLATCDPEEGIWGSQISLICVGTPSISNGNLDFRFVEQVSKEIGRVIKLKQERHAVVIRSTVLPGTVRDLVIPTLERESGKIAGVDFGVAYYPEFLREGSAIADYFDPGTVVYGRFDDPTISLLRDMNANLPVEPIIIEILPAEAVKYTNNAWHAVKISFANEIGNYCKAAGIDSHIVLDVLCADTRLNISKAYLKPGFAFGGSCLPKDLRALRHRAKSLDQETPILDAALTANEIQIQRAYDMVATSNKRRIGMVGLSFKPNTDDLRESPLLELAERLYGKGYDIRIFDPNIRYAALIGANKKFVQDRLPHLSQLLVKDIEEVCDHGEVIVLGNLDASTEGTVRDLNGDRVIVDLARISRESRSSGDYHGICW